MKFTAVIFVVALAVVPVAMAYISNECGEHEEYKDCGSPCIATCQNRQFANCIAQCKSGCFCKDGFIRKSDNGPCIAVRDCRYA